ncbi:diguanylate cyclase (GGDEF)-like protein [Kineococcus radiotolerans]|uniref:Diguanylate cyclase (GGDEF)-like protein n=1 Tax=Kineococcus radiotolerans TaxID=131568 RepID=A0A7W4TLE8_KINRA|nr:GGDEF domain-containing protein [Kineococcus radiotolerans]MBB2901086.1 diguanylate cyclase (GGDEF)-like protein [Kineococcus radiotolerans]
MGPRGAGRAPAPAGGRAVPPPAPDLASLRASEVFTVLCAPGLLILAVAVVVLVPEFLHPGTIGVVLGGGVLAPPVAAFAILRQRRTGRAQGWWSVWATGVLSVLTLSIDDPAFRQTAVMALVVGPLYAAMFTSTRSMLGHLALAVAAGSTLVAGIPGDGEERAMRVLAVQMVLVLSVVGLFVLRRRLDTAVALLTVARDRADDLAGHDPLTGLLNRRGLRLALEAAAPGGRGLGPTGAVLLDVDHFKTVNDTLGHDAGDAVLIRIAAVLTATARPTDLVARIGGEEFLVVATATEPGDVARLGERLRAAVAADGGRPPVTVSAGVASCPPEPGVPCLVDELQSRADRLLYRAKSTGRNRVCVEEPGEATPADPARAGAPAPRLPGRPG